jgi:hypothetical protein
MFVMIEDRKNSLRVSRFSVRSRYTSVFNSAIHDGIEVKLFAESIRDSMKVMFRKLSGIGP